MILINASSRETLKLVQDFVPIHPPVGVGYLEGYALSKGINVKHIDQELEDVEERVKVLISDLTPPYIFGFSVLTASFKTAVVTSEHLKKLYPDCFIVFGGVHPTMLPNESLAYDHIDAVVRGEAEQPLVDLYDCIKAGKDYTWIQNLSYKKDGTIHGNSIDYIVKDLDEYSWPYHLYKDDRYDMGFMMSSRGCPYRCIFCSIQATPGGRRYRYRTEDVIVDELVMLNEELGLTKVSFTDDIFTVNKKRQYRLTKKIKEKGLHKKMTFTFQGRGDHLTRELAEELYSAGFNTCLFGIETASEQIMKTIDKGETVAELERGIEIAKQVGMHVAGTYIFGLPGETHEDRMDCVRASEKLGLHSVRYNNATPYPGTALYHTAVKEGRLHNQGGMWENFVAVSGITENPFKQVPFAYLPPGPGNSEEEIKRDILLAHLVSYSHVGTVLKAIFKRSKNPNWFVIGRNPIEFLKKMPRLGFLAVMIVGKVTHLFYQLLIKKKTRLPLRHLFEIFSIPYKIRKVRQEKIEKIHFPHSVRERWL